MTMGILNTLEHVIKQWYILQWGYFFSYPIVKFKRNLKVLGKNPYQSHGLEQNFPLAWDEVNHLPNEKPWVSMVYHVFYVNLLEGITFFFPLCSTMFYYVLVCFTMFPSSINVSILRVSFAAPVSTCFEQAGGCSSVTFSRLPETTTIDWGWLLHPIRKNSGDDFGMVYGIGFTTLNIYIYI